MQTWSSWSWRVDTMRAPSFKTKAQASTKVRSRGNPKVDVGKPQRTSQGNDRKAPSTWGVEKFPQSIVPSPLGRQSIPPCLPAGGECKQKSLNVNGLSAEYVVESNVPGVADDPFVRSLSMGIAEIEAQPRVGSSRGHGDAPFEARKRERAITYENVLGTREFLLRVPGRNLAMVRGNETRPTLMSVLIV